VFDFDDQITEELLKRMAARDLIRQQIRQSAHQRIANRTVIARNLRDKRRPDWKLEWANRVATEIWREEDDRVFSRGLSALESDEGRLQYKSEEYEALANLIAPFTHLGPAKKADKIINNPEIFRIFPEISRNKTKRRNQLINKINYLQRRNSH